MLSMLRKRLREDADGFTLIELMVVVLIIAILIAIAIPTFLGAQDRARDRGAQSNLRNALTATKTIATDDAGKFTGVTVSALITAEGSLAPYVDGGPPTLGSVGLLGGGSTNPGWVFLYTKSASGMSFGIATNQSGKVGYCKNLGDVQPADLDNALTGCDGTKW